MKLPNWFRIIWWVLLTSALTGILYLRYPDLIAGRAAPVDVVFFVTWIGLMLVPLFQEVSLLGIKFKQEVESLKSFMAAQVSDIRSEVRNAVDIRTTVSPQINFPTPPPDAQLPAAEARIKSMLAEVLKEYGLAPVPEGAPTVSAPDDVNYLFNTRYAIEKELRRLAEGRIKVLTRRPVGGIALGRALVNDGLIDERLENAIREVYAVCSPAIHGEPVTSAQMSFVKDVSPQLIATLRSIK
jgi:hypothetical protein